MYLFYLKFVKAHGVFNRFVEILQANLFLTINFVRKFFSKKEYVKLVLLQKEKKYKKIII